MNYTDRRLRFRRILESDKCTYPVGTGDPISGRLAEHFGFDVGILSGSLASAIVLGTWDQGGLTLTDLTHQLRRITRVSNISLLVDGDHGFGNAHNTIRTINDIESAGGAAVTIEDTILPRPFGAKTDVLIPIPEMIGKLKAALAARSDPSFVIVARTSSLGTETLDKALERITAYTAVGVDAIMPFLATKASDIQAIHQATPLPLMLISDPPELKDHNFLSTNGVKMMFRADYPYYMGIKAMYDAFKHLADGNPLDGLKERADQQNMKQLCLDLETQTNRETAYMS